VGINVTCEYELLYKASLAFMVVVRYDTSPNCQTRSSKLSIKLLTNKNETMVVTSNEI